MANLIDDPNSASGKRVDPAVRDFIRDTPHSEPNDGWAADVGGEIIRTARERYLIYATIERCAQVAESTTYMSGAHIAAAIRALKGKP